MLVFSFPPPYNSELEAWVLEKKELENGPQLQKPSIGQHHTGLGLSACGPLPQGEAASSHIRNMKLFTREVFPGHPKGQKGII